ncbi:glycosyltransferase family 39 protein [Bryobacter aggregatus]|uniref:glycosyltransferase family 39 protein n=1 Tax=Bryobacter aggregatus TaxID=360054 RepID=UPI00056894E9|nr:glycosyltransferase family 39 protein [Bryobacter aggregatus]
MLRDLLILLALVIALRAPFLTQPIQGDDIYYLEGAQYAQTDPGHPHHARYLFQGRMVDMRGHPHPPLNAWILAGLLAAVGEVKEIPFHAAYAIFSYFALIGMYLLARRFTARPLLACALFAVVPAFFVNGNSLESDIPFLAFWMLGIAFFYEALERKSSRWLLLSILPLSLAGLAAYQSVFAIPILWFLTGRKRPIWFGAYCAALAPAIVLGLYNIVEASGGAAPPLQVTAGYFKEYGLQQLSAKIRNAEGLSGHLGWMVFPLLPILAFRSLWMCAALLWVVVAPNPLYVMGVAASIGLLTQETRKYGWWPQLFFAGSLVLFFAGSARYLLPMAAPIVLMTVAKLEDRPSWLYGGLVANLILGFCLAWSNYQHWAGYRDFVAAHASEIRSQRVWVNGEWGLRFYAESLGALPLAQGQAIRPGDLILTSELGYPIPFTVGGGQLVNLAKQDIIPTLPFRLIGLNSHSGYSTVSAGVLPFDFNRGPVDRVRLERVIESKPTLSYITMGDPNAERHILSGAYQLEEQRYRWIGQQARLILQPQKATNDLSATVYIPDIAKARKIRLEWNGKLAVEQVFDQPGLYTVTAKDLATGIADGILTIECDAVFQAPGDTRELGVILQEAGLR